MRFWMQLLRLLERQPPIIYTHYIQDQLVAKLSDQQHSLTVCMSTCDNREVPYLQKDQSAI